MNTPLYKPLKQSGTTFYAFPSAANDISSAYQNNNLNVYFSNYTLLNLPKKTDNTFNFDSFSCSNQDSVSFGDGFVESLRNYVANMDVTIRNSKIDSNTYFYDNSIIQTTTERIFWKWCSELNLIQFEPAIPGTDYINLSEFDRNNNNDSSYFPEILWKERAVNTYQISSINLVVNNNVCININNITNFREGDNLIFNNITTNNPNILGLGLTNSSIKVLSITSYTSSQSIYLNLISMSSSTVSSSGLGNVTLDYSQLVCYMSEIQGVNNVQNPDQSYTEVIAHIPDNVGITPDILFRVKSDNNYQPGYNYPILPNQYQPEIIGSENFNSPIVSNPNNYPGNYYGQFDTPDYTYTTKSGDSIRRSGDYYGITGDINDNIITGKIDGVVLDFDPSHYVKMNIPGSSMTSFEIFSSFSTDGNSPSNFEFNAILWYYTIIDNNGNTSTNLYGISLMDNPNNNTKLGEVGLKFPTYTKLVANDKQDGTSYILSLDLNYMVTNDNPTIVYNPEAINSLYSFQLYNNAMNLLAKTNQSFKKILDNNIGIQQDILNMKQLLYTQQSIDSINSKINNLNSLLKLYSTVQIVNSDTILSKVDTSTSPYTVKLTNNSTIYNTIYNINVSSLYNNTTLTPYSIQISDNTSFLINIINDDVNDVTLDSNLKIIINGDLNYRQYFDLYINSDTSATQNKKIDIIIYSNDNINNTYQYYNLISNINLPVYTNTNGLSNLYLIDDFKVLDIDSISKTKSLLTIKLKPSFNISLFSPNDFILLNNFILSDGTNYSDQYKIKNVNVNSINTLDINLSTNNSVNSYTGTTFNLLYNPLITYNKGITYKVIRKDSTLVFSDKYIITKNNI